MAPVVGMVNIGGIDYSDDGRDQSGPYDIHIPIFHTETASILNSKEYTYHD